MCWGRNREEARNAVVIILDKLNMSNCDSIDEDDDDDDEENGGRRGKLDASERG